MPWRPPSHRALTRPTTPHDPAQSQHRRALHGPDPRGTQRWRRLRARILAHFPLCMDPYFVHATTGQIVPATEVDHRKGLWDHPELMWEESNLQALCSACHHRKSTEERRSRRASNP